jgi:hypothetical protein
VIQQKNSASDEALIVLLHYYLGEANSEDELKEIVTRGKRMLPYLREYQSKVPRIDGKNYDDMLLPVDTVREFFTDAIDLISKGQTIE